VVFGDEFAHGRDKSAGNLHDGVVRFGEGRCIFGQSFLRRLLFIVREDAPSPHSYLDGGGAPH